MQGSWNQNYHEQGFDCHPKQVYDWFMICFIDSYEWVMVANVFGMSQYALEGITMMTRPYISSSNYILKMSEGKSYDKSEGWSDIWDALYYSFLDKHQAALKKIYAMAPHVNRWMRMNVKDKQRHLSVASKFLGN